MEKNYELNIISHHPKFEGERLVKHAIDNVDTIGVWGSEPFGIEFKNNTGNRVQVKISLDGTDILTGDRADDQSNSKMWLVSSYGTLNLSAWPETNENGARFVFGATSNSVAAHTHGDLSKKGIISAAVFVESYVEPPTFRKLDAYPVSASPIRRRRTSYDSDFALELCSERVDSRVDSKGLEKGPAIGAGETISQKIHNVQGLRQPKFDRVVSLKYVWYDDLKLAIQNQMPGFFVKVARVASELQPKKLANLGSTPRVDQYLR